MQKVLTIFGTIVGSYLIGFLVWVGVQNTSPEKSLGSVVQGSEYLATSTRNAIPAGTYRISTTSTNSIDLSAGSIGSITITSSSPAGGFQVWDANTVATNTLIADFPANAAVGTYVFDAALKRGLTIFIGGSFNGHIVTTYRVQ